MKLLVIGAGGQVGTELVKRAKNVGFDVIPAKKVDLDITQLKETEAKIVEWSPDIIINSAAYTAVDRAEEEEIHSIAVNAKGPRNLAKICGKYDIPLFHLSTDYVFDGHKNSPYIEADEASPLSIYGITKLQGDEAVLELEKSIVLRVSWVFGETGSNFVKTMLQLSTKRETLRVVNDQFGAPTWAGDISATLIELCLVYESTGSLNWGVYHFSGSPSVSWFEFAKEIFEQALNIRAISSAPDIQPIPSSKFPTKAARPKNSMLDCSKIQSVFRISQPNWEIGLKKVIQSWKANEACN